MRVRVPPSVRKLQDFHNLATFFLGCDLYVVYVLRSEKDENFYIGQTICLIILSLVCAIILIDVYSSIVC